MQKKPKPKNKVLKTKQILTNLDVSKINYKVTDAEFLAFLRAGMGLFHRTAKLIQNEGKNHDPNFTYSRQAVEDRAKRLDPQILADIRNTVLDIAEDVQIRHMHLLDNPNVAQRASEFVLSRIGKDRGYVERKEIESVGKQIFDLTIIDEPDGSEKDKV